MLAQFPKRIMTAHWLSALAVLGVVRWAFSMWMFLDDHRTSASDSFMLLLFGTLITIAFLVAFLTAAKWLKKSDPRGHYLAAACLALMVALGLPRGLNGEVIFAFGFFILLVKDIRAYRATPPTALTVAGYQLAEFWGMPWLVSGSIIAMVGHGGGAVPAVVLHLLSPIAVIVFHVRLKRNPAVSREFTPSHYYWSLGVWVVFYLVTLGFGLLMLKGLSGLAMQGAGA